MSAILKCNGIVLPTGAAVYIETGNGKPVELVKSEEKNYFMALFEHDDVDFQIVVENDWRLPVRPRRVLGIDIITATKRNGFCIVPSQVAIFKTIEDAGGRFHFISQKTDGGRQLVGAAAKLLKTSVTDAAKQVSRIEFQFEVEKVKQIGLKKVEKLEEEFLKFLEVEESRKKPPILIGECIKIVVATLTGKRIPVEIGMDNTVEDLKHIIEITQGIPVYKQRIILAGKQLTNEDKILDAGISNGKMVRLVLRLTGGGDGSVSPKLPSTAPVEDSKKIDESTCNENENLRGVVCFGQKSKQKFGPVYSFIPDKNIKIEPVVLELMLKSKLTL